MLKTRIIGAVLVKNAIAVQSIHFKHYLPLGKPEIAIQYLDKWGVDEIVVLNIDGAQSNQAFSAEQIKSYAKQCRVPLSIGGGIRHIDTVKKIIRAGADKIILNTAAFNTPSLITQASDLFGQQCVVISIDSKRDENKSIVMINGGRKNSAVTINDFAKKMQDIGAGEIFLNSIDQDGSKKGYDLALIQSAAKVVNIPVIACGGAGHPQHAYDAIAAGASAVAVGNYFHFTEHSVILFKKYLASLNAAIRTDCDVTYKNNTLTAEGRVMMQPDDILNNLRFQYIPEEAI